MEIQELSRGIVDLDEAKAVQIINEFLASGPSDTDINQAIKACQEGMSEVGKRFESGEYFIAELVFAAEILKGIMELVRPRIGSSGVPTIGRIVLGTAKGDIHDIGKNIVRDMLEATGFEVYDVGVDVPYERFVDKVREVHPEIVGISGLLTFTIESMKGTVDAIKSAGLRDNLNIIIGGTPVTKAIATYVGADAFTTSAAGGVEICKKMVRA